MNPAQPQLAATASASQFSPSASPLHPPSVQHNLRVLSSLSTLAACFSGLAAGIIGLTNYSGFLLYILTSTLSAVLNAYIKCGGLSAGEMVKYVPQAHAGSAGVAMGQSQAQGGQQTTPWKGWLALSGVGQEGFLGFLLFWIGGYALIHVYD